MRLNCSAGMPSQREEQLGGRASEVAHLARELYGQGDQISAAVAYRQAARLAPQSLRPQIELMAGLVLAELGDDLPAKRALRRAAKAGDLAVANRAQSALRVIDFNGGCRLVHRHVDAAAMEMRGPEDSGQLYLRLRHAASCCSRCSA